MSHFDSKKFIKTVFANPSGTEMSSLLLNYFISKEIVLDDEDFHSNATVEDRYDSLRIITNGLLMFSLFAGVLLTIISAIPVVLKLDFLFDAMVVLIGVTAINVTCAALYLSVKTFPGQLKSSALIKNGSGDDIIGQSSYNLYNSDYIKGFIFAGIPCCVIFIIAIVVFN